MRNKVVGNLRSIKNGSPTFTNLTIHSVRAEVRDYLLVATSVAVRGLPLNVSFQEDVTLPLAGMGGSHQGFAVEYDGTEEAIFYNDRGRGIVYKASANGTRECGFSF